MALAATLGRLETARDAERRCSATGSSREYDWDEATDATEAVYATVLRR